MKTITKKINDWKVEDVEESFDKFLKENDLDIEFDFLKDIEKVNDFITSLHYEIIDNIEEIEEIEEIENNIMNILDEYIKILPF